MRKQMRHSTNSTSWVAVGKRENDVIKETNI